MSLQETSTNTQRDPRIMPPMGDFGLATVSDAFELCCLFEEFFEQSDYGKKGIAYSRQNALGWLTRVIGNGSFPHVVARVDGKIVGVISWSMDTSFCADPIAILHTIYVTKAHRRSIMGRMLVALAMDIAKSEGATSFSAPLASGMKEMKSLMNLFNKAGFESSGVIMTRAI